LTLIAATVREVASVRSEREVEQNALLALSIAHYGYVLESGRIILSGNAAALLDDERVQRAYLS
jgi:ABC-type branched-subunit amino acid transport system ATPase component